MREVQDLLGYMQDGEGFFLEKRDCLNHFFQEVYEVLMKPPFSLYFYLTFSKILGKEEESQDEVNLTILKECLQSYIKDYHCQTFLYFNTDTAVKLVRDLVEEAPAHPNGKGSLLDKELKQFALKLKKQPHFEQFKEAALLDNSKMGLGNQNGGFYS